jgi:hypothetical protein
MKVEVDENELTIGYDEQRYGGGQQCQTSWGGYYC